jgi:hypothetical protein
MLPQHSGGCRGHSCCSAAGGFGLQKSLIALQCVKWTVRNVCCLKPGQVLLLLLLLLVVVLVLAPILQLPALLLWQLLRMTGERRRTVASGLLYLLRQQRRRRTRNDWLVTALNQGFSSCGRLLLLQLDQLLLLRICVRGSGSQQCWSSRELLQCWCCLLQ